MFGWQAVAASANKLVTRYLRGESTHVNLLYLGVVSTIGALLMCIVLPNSFKKPNSTTIVGLLFANGGSLIARLTTAKSVGVFALMDQMQWGECNAMQLIIVCSKRQRAKLRHQDDKSVHYSPAARQLLQFLHAQAFWGPLVILSPIASDGRCHQHGRYSFPRLPG